jgi:hypothetical protein
LTLPALLGNVAAAGAAADERIVIPLVDAIGVGGGDIGLDRIMTTGVDVELEGLMKADG